VAFVTIQKKIAAFVFLLPLIMPKKSATAAAAAVIIKDVENVDDATAMMGKLSVAVKETKKNKKEKTPVLAEVSVNETTNPPVPAPFVAEDPSFVAVEPASSTSGGTPDDDDHPLDDNGQVQEVVSDEKQLEYLDQMFDDQAREKMNIKLPPGVKIRTDLLKTKLMPHQVQGVKWLIKQELNSDPHPLYKVVTNKSGTIRHRCTLTGRSKNDAPAPIKGGILADEYVCLY
jgi:SNF2 family DNA or RNA helicase